MSTCPLCLSDRFEPFLEIAKTPVQIGVAWPTRDEALNASTGDVRLAICQDCGLVFNQAFEPELVTFEPGYDVSLAHSPTYTTYLQEEVRRLVNLHGIRNRAVVELGCGDGYFLRLLCRLGGNTGDGFDPSLPAEQSEAAGAGHMRLHPRRYRPTPQQTLPALVVARSVLELVPEPGDFLRMLTSIASPSSLVYLEVPNAGWLLRNKMAWNIHYEHRSYFTADVLRRACESRGLRVLECIPCYMGGQYLRLLAVAGGIPGASPRRADLRKAELAQGFAFAYREIRSAWIERLRSWNADGMHVVLWGAGGRGTSFVSAVDPRARLIDFAIDVNPARHGAFLPMTGHSVRPPAALRDAACDVLLVSNATYEREISAAARDEGFEGEIWTL